MPGLQSIRYDEVTGRPLFAGLRRSPGANSRIQLFTADGDKVSAIGGDLGAYVAGSIAVAKQLAVVPLTASNELAAVGPAQSALRGKAPTGRAPFGAASSRARAAAR